MALTFEIHRRHSFYHYIRLMQCDGNSTKKAQCVIWLIESLNIVKGIFGTNAVVMHRRTKLFGSGSDSIRLFFLITCQEICTLWENSKWNLSQANDHRLCSNHHSRYIMHEFIILEVFHTPYPLKNSFSLFTLAPN